MIQADSIKSLKTWKETHSRASDVVAFFRVSKEQGFTKDDRASIHRSNIEKLQNLKTFVVSEKENILANIGNPGNQQLRDGTKINFDYQTLNLLVKKAIYAQRLLQSQKILFTNQQIEYFIHYIEDIDAILELLNDTKVLPKDIICKIQQSYFYLTIPPENATLQFQIIALQKYLDGLENTIKALEKPLWAIDFIQYFNKVLQDNLHKLDKVLSYIGPINEEDSLSRCIFGGHAPKVQEHIDYVADMVLQMPPNEYIKFLLDECMQLIPDNENKTSDEQAVGLMIYYRILFNRLFERYENIFFLTTPEDENKLIALADLPAKLFSMPEDYAPEVEGNATMRQVFQKDYMYNNSAQFLNFIVFMTNPIDVLFYVHKALLAINKAALMRRLKGQNASIDDIQQILCFDDLFILFYGVMCAADLPDLYGISSFVTNYTPAFCLTNSFEYAQAGIEALIIHLNGLNIPQLIEKANSFKDGKEEFEEKEIKESDELIDQKESIDNDILDSEKQIQQESEPTLNELEKIDEKLCSEPTQSEINAESVEVN